MPAWKLDCRAAKAFQADPSGPLRAGRPIVLTEDVGTGYIGPAAQGAHLGKAGSRNGQAPREGRTSQSDLDVVVVRIPGERPINQRPALLVIGDPFKRKG